jgi:polar amino acid transport system permease protein
MTSEGVNGHAKLRTDIRDLEETSLINRAVGTAGQPLKPGQRRRGRWYGSVEFDILQFVALSAVLIWVILRGAQGMGYNWQWAKVPRYLYRVVDGEVVLGPLTKGLLVTLDITWIAMLLCIAIGTGVAVLRLSGSRIGRAIAWTYIEVIRNTPILVQILIMYFIIGRIFSIPRFWAGVLCLAFYEGAFAAEIIRGGITSVRKGQWEAARSLGLSAFDVYRDIVIPQAIPLMLPPLAGVLVNLVKHSAIVSVIAVFDLATQARTVVSDTFLAFEIWFTAACMYLCVTIAISLVASWLERRYNCSTLAS